MASYTRINLEDWDRKDTFDFFNKFELPFFNITAKVNVEILKTHCTQTNSSFFLAGLYYAMKAANDIAAFKMRIRENRVIQFAQLRVGSTIQYEDKSFGFCYFPYCDSLDSFQEEGELLLKDALSIKEFSPKDGEDDLIHFSVLPWVNFSSIQHARRIGQEDSIPKIVFGKYEQQASAVLMPVSVEVHHGLVDGYHVGLFFDKFQKTINNPE